MADITVKGFVSKPQTKAGQQGKGDFSTFTLKEGQKQKDGTYLNFFYNVTQFNEANPPADGSKVSVTGYLKMRPYEVNGVNGVEKRTSYDVVASAVEVLAAPQPKPEEGKAEEDGFDL